MLKYLFFDLDNTLYSCRWGLENNVKQRMRKFIAGFLNTTPDEAWQQRTAHIKKYGTTLEWLITEKGFTNVEAFLAAVHPPDEADSLLPDPELKTFLEGIPIPRAIITNSPREHADLILDKLDMAELFTHIFDIRLCNFKGKPHPDFFNHALNVLGVSAGEVLFIDDTPLYVEGFNALGGRGLLLDEDNVYTDYAYPKIRGLKELYQYVR
ncbi:MAG: HAD-IA family hydrolase [Treponema sp.]|jgi:putative hydrolase of the HAD superfamily|nr:HAD-IA family hydrolase [Treponema sp.]